MEVLFITHKYPPSVGGMERQSYEIIKFFKEQNHHVHTLIYDNKEGKFNFFLKLQRRAKKILNQNPGIQLIHLNDGLMACFGIRLKKITNIPILATFHGLDIVFPAPWYQKWLLPPLYNLDGIISVSHATKKQCIVKGFTANKIKVIVNGVDHSIAQIPTERDFIKQFETQYNIKLSQQKILVLMGRPVKRKGFSWFLNNVLPHLSEDVLVIVIGDIKKTSSYGQKLYQLFTPRFIKNQIDLILGASTDNKAVIQAVHQPNIKDKVIITGKLAFNDMIQVLSFSNLFIMPNIKIYGDMEGFGLVALEAALRKLPVLAAGIEGITDAVINGKNGYLLPSADVNSWVQKINELIKSPEQLQNIGQQAKQYTLNTYSWEKMGKAYETYFNQTINTHHSLA